MMTHYFLGEECGQNPSEIGGVFVQLERFTQANGRPSQAKAKKGLYEETKAPKGN